MSSKKMFKLPIDPTPFTDEEEREIEERLKEYEGTTSDMMNHYYASEEYKKLEKKKKGR